MSFGLGALLRGVDGVQVVGGVSLDAVSVTEVRDDSRLVQAGDLFVAVPGAAQDGRRFIADAAARGASVVVTEGTAPAGFAGVVVLVPRVRHALALIAANRYGAAGELALLAVTGTNGKTTNTYVVEAILRAAGRGAGVIGTVNNRISVAGGEPVTRPTANTTPGALTLHGLFAEMRAAGVTDVVLEATSHALEQGRLDGCQFRVAALTNFTQDHLDFHGTMERYFEAKAILFERLLDPARGVAVTFVDQAEGLRMRARSRGRTLGVARRPGVAGADVVVEHATLDADGTRLTLATPRGRLELTSRLVGGFNLDNLALAVGIGVAADLPFDAIRAGIAGLPTVPGRLERVGNARGVLCVVDYAHTPDALLRAIEAVRPYVKGKLVVVFGCGGDRDTAKRPLMGEIAARGAELVIVTSDNPRTEDLTAIVDGAAEGARRTGARELGAEELRPGASARGYHRQVDRRAAIRVAIGVAVAGDVVLIAGKGHEDYQILGTTKVHFDDREEAAAAFALEAN